MSYVMVLQIILLDILVIVKKNTTQLVNCPHILSVKPSNNVYLFQEIQYNVQISPCFATETIAQSEKVNL